MKNFIISIILLIFLTSCHKIAPSAFWNNFHNDLIVSQSNNQGPWGGRKEIYWKTVKDNTFLDNDITKFADEHNWKIIDSISFTNTFKEDELSKLDVDTYSLDILKENILRKQRLGGDKIFIFKTNWLNVEPGSSRETFQNGYVILNSNGTEMKMYHFWGE